MLMAALLQESGRAAAWRALVCSVGMALPAMFWRTGRLLQSFSRSISSGFVLKFLSRRAAATPAVGGVVNVAVLRDASLR